jgi:alpha-2-macroglobulin
MQKIINQLCLIVIFSSLIFSCGSDKQKEEISINPGFSNYISAFTSGEVSKVSPIRIQLVEEFKGEINLNQPIKDKLFEFTPSISGKTYWRDNSTIEFVPDEWLPSNQVYTADFKLDKLIDVTEEFETFVFRFKTYQQGYSFQEIGLDTYDYNDLTRQKFEARIVLADVADTNQIKKMVSVSQANKNLDITWYHSESNTHTFVAENVVRGTKPSELKVKIDGSPVEIKEDVYITTIEVPSLDDFRLMRAEVVYGEVPSVKLWFSDLLKQNQDLNGLITIKGINNLSYEISGHEIRVFLPFAISEEKEVIIHSGILNSQNKKLTKSVSRLLKFESIKPEVRLVTSGVILPTSEKGVVFPFEAVSLSHVDVYITKVYESNMIQFLQVNDFDGNYQMKRVAAEVTKKTINLRQQLTGKNPNLWHRFHLKLDDIINTEPGAIYQLEFRIKKQYALYGCTDGSEESSSDFDFEIEDNSWTEKDWEQGYYDYYYDDYYYDYDDYDYDYRDRDNPCKNYYYTRRTVKTNILSSNIGITAKAGSDKKIHVFLNDIKTSNPLANVDVEFYDFQQQLIGTSKTNSDGMLEMYLDKKPFVLIAKKGKERGYLKLRDGEALSVSKFDVSGETIQKGVKGFIYAERGVWRPGDTIFAKFILEDKNNVLPDNHPIVFKFYNPKGQLVDKKVSTSGLNGFYNFTTTTNPDDITGNYFAKVQVGNREFTKYLKVETIKPNRLKIYLDFQNSEVIKSDNQTANLKVKWLHGAIAKHLQAKIDLTLESTKTTFSKHNDYSFDDPAKVFHADEKTIFTGKLDGEGNATVSPSINVKTEAPGMLSAFFITKVFEEGGGFSIDRKVIKYSPFESYVGVKVPKGNLYRGTLETGKEHTFDIASLSDKGNPIGKEVEVKVYRLEWRWWWSGGSENEIMNFISQSSSVPVFSKEIKTQNGKANFKFGVEQSNWGRFLVRITDKESGHSCGEIFYMDTPYWARSNRKDNENATMLSFSTDKEKYTVGEKVQLTFPSPADGKALITVESGSKVIQKHIVTTTKGETKFTLSVTEHMAPNAYVCISLIQPHQLTENDLPVRMYGIVPIEVEDPNTHITPVIIMADVLRPETTASIKIKEQKGKPMTYSLAIVDEGLLDLTSFKTPNPWTHFYSREALGVKTWDMYDKIIGAFGAKIDKLFAIGGDGDGKNNKPAKANRFKPMVTVIGPFALPAGKTMEHKIAIPNYVGSVRVMVVAGQDLRYGNAEKAVPVRSPLMVLGTLPRVVGPGETVELPVNIFAMEKHVKDVSIEVKANDMFTMLGNAKQNIKFSSIGDEVVNFSMKVKNKIGIGKVEIIARSGKEISRYEIEIDVRSPNPSITEVVEHVIQPGETWTSDYILDGVVGTNHAKLEVSSIPPINLEKRLNYLIRYPHGCIEQTTSAAFPQLYLSGLMDLDSKQKSEIQNNISAAIDKLSKYQLSNGGFAYWPGANEVNDWGTTYAGHFIIEAESKGYSLPYGMKKKWIDYMTDRARQWRYQNYGRWEYLTQAYRLYTLALAGAPDLGAMNRMKENSNLTDEAKWRLAAAYVLVGRKDVAIQLVQTASTDIAYYEDMDRVYGSVAREQAMVLESLVLMANRNDAAKIAKSLSEALSQDQWMSTQTTAYALMAISKFVGESNISKQMNYTYQINGGQSLTNKSETTINTFEISRKKETGKIKVKNNGKNVLFVRVIQHKVPIESTEEAYAKGLAMDVTFKTMNGTTISPSSIEQGTDFVAEVTIVNKGYKSYSNLALSQIFPSGWEIHNTRMDNFTSAVSMSTFDYQDIRDDRVYTYFYLGKGQSKTFRVILNATYLGKFYLPFTHIEAMYDNSITARNKGQWIEVVKSKNEQTATN